MTLNISVPTTTQELSPKITVIGVGGAGGNAVNNMIEANLEGIEFLVANTDGQALVHSLAERKIQLGRQHTQGLGAGSKPEVGRIAAEESLDDILAELTDSHMVFITAGMGGGTGTGAAPVIARAARDRGILTVGVVTKPFDFEGQVRMRQANAGIEELQAYVDTLIIVPNQNLFRLANERTTFADAFAMADDVLHKGVRGITDLMIKPGDINLDFADIRAVMAEMGKAMMGTGEASGENRATNAAEAAVSNPLLDETSMNGAQAVLINITGGNDMTLFEVDEAANHIRREVDIEANIIIGSAIDERMDGIMRVSVVATGMEAGQTTQRPPHLVTSTQDLKSEIRPRFTKPATSETPVAKAANTEDPAEEAEVMQDDEKVESDVMMTEEEHDDGQQSLEDLVAEAERHDAETSKHDQAVEDDTPVDEPAMNGAEESTPTENDKTEDEPFALRAIVDIPEETAEDEAPKSLIGHIAGMFTSKSEKTEAETSLEEVEASPRADEVNLMDDPGLSSTSASGVAGHQEETTEEAAANEDAEKAASPMPADAAKTPAKAETKAVEEARPLSRVASLKPTEQPKLDIERTGEDVDLDIPAFLRRQAN
jgi:cell division protein FtsZ